MKFYPQKKQQNENIQFAPYFYNLRTKIYIAIVRNHDLRTFFFSQLS